VPVRAWAAAKEVSNETVVDKNKTLAQAKDMDPGRDL